MRYSELDSLKGLLIILMVIGHSDCFREAFPFFYKFIYSFHMPVFFLLSGYFAKPLTEPLIIMFKKNANAYLKPYLFTCIVLSIVVPIYYFCVFNKQYGKTDELLLRCFYSTEGKWQIGPIWFLWALFWGLSFYRWMYRTVSGIKQFYIILCLFVLVVPSKFFYLPFCIQSGISAIPYIYIGNLLHKNRSEIEIIINNRLCVFLLFIIWAYTVFRLEVHISGVVYPHGLTSVFCTSFISVFIICKAKRIDNSALCFIGKHTLLILCVHQVYKGLSWFVFNPISSVNISLYKKALLEIAYDLIPVMLISILIILLKEKIMKSRIFK